MSAPRQRVATLAARIHAVIRRPFAATPIDILTDRRITLADRTVLAYMLARAAQPGWTLYVGEVQRSMGLSSGGWQACRRRLMAAGYYSAVRRRKVSGEWAWEITVTDTPRDLGAVLDKPTVPHCMTEGGPSRHDTVDRRSSTNTCIRTQEYARARETRATSAPGIVESSVGRAPSIYHGCRVWSGTDDRARIDACISRVGAARVEEIADEIRVRIGRMPLPSDIEEALAAADRTAHEEQQASIRPAAPDYDPAAAFARDMKAFKGGRP